MRDDTLQRVQAWLKEHADCAGHEFDLCALVDSAIIDAMPKPDAWKGQDDKPLPEDAKIEAGHPWAGVVGAAVRLVDAVRVLDAVLDADLVTLSEDLICAVRMMQDMAYGIDHSMCGTNYCYFAGCHPGDAPRPGRQRTSRSTRRRFTVANNFIQFSEELTGLTEEEANWLELMSNLASDRDVDFKENDDRQHFSDEGDPLTEEARLACMLFSDEPIISAEAQKDEEDKTWTVWFYSDESNDPNAVAELVRAFFQKFRPDGDDVFTLTWCDYCDKLRIGEFGGGCFAVNKKDILIENVNETLEILKEKLNA